MAHTEAQVSYPATNTGCVLACVLLLVLMSMFKNDQKVQSPFLTKQVFLKKKKKSRKKSERVSNLSTVCGIFNMLPKIVN